MKTKLTKEQALAKIEELKRHVESLEKKKTVWDLEQGDGFWYVDDDGCVSLGEWEEGDPIDSFSLSIGDIFLTEKDAEAELEYRQAYQRVKEYIHDEGFEFGPDWDEARRKRWDIYYDHWVKEFFEDVDTDYQVQDRKGFYFKSKEDAENVIEHCEDDLKTLWGVEK
jgi:hypothetical protein